MSDPVLIDSVNDPFYSDVVCLLKMNGDDAGTVFTDEIGHTFTAYGDAKTTTSTYFVGGSCGAFDGTGDYIASPDGTAMSPGAGKFTIDALVKFNVVGESNIANCSSGNSHLQREWAFYLLNSTTFAMYIGVRAESSQVYSFTIPTVTANSWYHFAVQRTASNVLECYVNGVKSASTHTTTSDFTGHSTHSLFVGAFGANLAGLHNGYINNIRITRNTRYSGNFKPLDSYYPPKLYTPKVQPFSFLPYGA